MSALLEPLTLEEFLAWERGQEPRYEFDGIQPVGMTGGGRSHSRTQTRLVVALGTRVAAPCEVHGSELKVVTQTRVRYPDASVVGSDQEAEPDVIEPTAVFEVMSPSSSLTDRRVKPIDYASVPSIMVYGILDAERPEVTIMRRAAGWEPETFVIPDAMMPLPEIGIDLPLASIYPR
ncbi:MAG TPA: Uma2 family endonuclease [Rhodopila sp.]